MSDPDVCHIGSVLDVHGREVRVGVDHDAVKIDGPPGMMLGLDVLDDFHRYFLDADNAAYLWAQAQDGQASDE